MDVRAGVAVGGLVVALLWQRQRLCAAAAHSHVYVKLRARAMAWLVAISGSSSTLTRLAPVEQLAPNVLRVLGLNPGRMTLQGTNTYVVGTGAARILIDTGDGSQAYLDLLLTALAAHGVETLSNIVLTHAHFDHIGGLWQLQARFPDAKVWKMLTYAPSACECSAHVSNAYAIDGLQIFDLATLLANDEVLTTDGAVLRPVYTPGHTNDHVCFLLDDDDAIFTGDCVLGEGTCTFQSLSEYMTSLRALRACNPTRLYPGHGPVVEKAVDTIDMYLSHRQKREDEILAVLTSKGPVDVSTIVAAMYPSLPYFLSLAAARNVRMHLRKLLDDGQVREVPSTSWWSRTPRYAMATVPSE